jgi:alkylation response protein AidB-like acyl-CoA dehydrogenase
MMNFSIESSAALDAICLQIFEHAGAVDAEGVLPFDDIASMSRAGLLEAAIARRTDRSSGLSPCELSRILQSIGAASLTVGRLYEGHVNAAGLIARYGSNCSLAILDGEARDGRLLGVWNAERRGGPTLTPTDGGWLLSGRKVHCSGAGHIRRPIVTARSRDDSVVMVMPDLTDAGVTIDASVWRTSGMRGTATATVDFETVFVPKAAVIGGPGDYYRSPVFSGGAWRVLAVQLGGLHRILELHSARLIASGRGSDPVFRARFAEAAADYECARLLVAEAARRAEDPHRDPAEIGAYVDQARARFEGFANASIASARRNVGLSSFIAPDSLDRCIRDLEVYLRQPFVDTSRDNAARWLLEGGSFSS